MDISYILYYVMMDDLRQRLQERFPQTFFGSGNYLSSDLTHIYDVERLEGTVFPEGIIGEIEISFTIHNLLYGSLIRIERCQLYSSSKFVLETKNKELREVIEDWILAVKIRYFMKKLTN